MRATLRKTAEARDKPFGEAAKLACTANLPKNNPSLNNGWAGQVQTSSVAQMQARVVLYLTKQRFYLLAGLTPPRTHEMQRLASCDLASPA